MRNSKYKYSVIITLYNKEKYIARAIRSILRQSINVQEIIVIDDKSEDSSLKVLKDTFYEEKELCKAIAVKIIELEKNGGQSAARNKALKKVEGDYVFLLDADDEYLPGYFEKAEKIFTEHNADLLFVGFQRDEGGRRRPDMLGLMPIIEEVKKDTYFLPSAVSVLGDNAFGLNGSNVVVKKEVIDGLFYKEDVKHFEGIDFWYRTIRRIEEHNGKIFLLAGVWVTIHLTGDSVSRKPLRGVDDLAIPCQFAMFSNSKNLDDQKLRKRIFIIWVKNSMIRLPNLREKIIFFWRFKKEILINSWLNLIR